MTIQLQRIMMWCIRLCFSSALLKKNMINPLQSYLQTNLLNMQQEEIDESKRQKETPETQAPSSDKELTMKVIRLILRTR